MSDEAGQVPAGLTTDGLLARRYIARFIDYLLIGLLILGVLRLIGAPSEQFNLIGLAVMLILWIGYGSLFESSPWQATLGKRLMGLRVYDSQAGRLKPLQAGGRNLAKDGAFLALVFVPGGRLLSMVWLGAHLLVLYRSPVYQAIHDRAAHTWVAAPEQTTQLRLS
jgi:uncharacterized RDD family membrane protein YckC